MFQGNRAEEFETPIAFVKYIEDRLEVVFTLDAAADENNTKAPVWIDIEEDCFKARWGGTVWLNPPYGRKIPNFLERVNSQTKNCDLIAVLLPARVCTRWFHDLVVPYVSEIYFIKGRLNHHHHSSVDNSCAPFPSMLLIYRGEGGIIGDGKEAEWNTLEPTLRQRGN